MNFSQGIRLLAEQIEACKRCDLYKSTTHSVPGEGNLQAKIVFVGEAPGFHEDKKGKPFVGNAEKLLNSLLAKVGLDREDVFITNVIKHRPPQNRDPLPNEVAACKHWLDKQLAFIAPKVIVTLGRWSLNYFLPEKKISQVHGIPLRFNNNVLLPMYHPAAAFRNGQFARALEEDFQRNINIFQDPNSALNLGEDQDEKGQERLF